MERPICYDGDQAYIFVSYAHRDSEQVWPIIDRMQRDGFRVWYDDGIDPGTEWDENIASHVAGCGYFIAFLSENYLNSDNCKDELNYSRDQGKPQLLIYMEDVQLPHGMAMRLGRNQAIFHNRYENEEDFYDKLYDAQDIRYYNGTNQAPEVKTAETLTSQTFRTARGKKLALWPILVAVLLITAAFFLRPKTQPEAVPEGTSGNTAAEAETAREPVTNVLLADTEELKITALRTSLDSRYYVLTLNVKNKAKEDIYLSTEQCYLNGVFFEPDWHGIVAAGEDNLVELHWERETAQRYGIDPENITRITLNFSGIFQDDSGEIEKCSCSYDPFGEEHVEYVTWTPSEDDLVVCDTQDYQVAFVNIHPGEAGKQWRPELVCINRTDKEVSFGIEKETINGYQDHFNWGTTVEPGCIKYSDIYVPAMSWMSTGYEQVLSYTGEMQVKAWDSKTGSGEQLAAKSFALYPAGEEAAQVLGPREITPKDLLVETEFLRAAYLGAAEYDGHKADLVYLQNLSDKTREFYLEFAWDEEMTCNSYELEPFQEIVVPHNRVVSVWGGEEQATLCIRKMDEEGYYSDYEETFRFTLREPDE